MISDVAPWKEVERKTVFEKYGRSVEKVLFQLPVGTVKDFYIQAEKSTVCVFALTKEGKVVLIRQYRPGPKEVLTELPGGYVDSNELPIDAIKRELLEETGYSGKISLLNSVFYGAYSNRVKHLFIATECELVSERALDQSEEGSRVVLFSISEFEESLATGKLTDADCAYAGLLHLKTS